MSLTRPACDRFFFLNLIALWCAATWLLSQAWQYPLHSLSSWAYGQPAVLPPRKQLQSTIPQQACPFVTLVSWYVTVPLSRQGYRCSLVQTWAKAKFLSNPRTFDFFLWISVGAEEHLKHWPIVLQSVIHFAVMTSSTIPWNPELLPGQF